MAQAAPATKANQLIQRLAAVTWARAQDQLEIRRIEREAGELMKVDAAGAHAVLGGAAAARGDAEATREHYRVALRLASASPAQYHARRNYSIALAILEEHVDAFDVVTDMLREYPDDLDLLEHAMTEAIETANFAEAKLLCARLDSVDVQRDRKSLTSDLDLLVEAVSEGVFTDQGVRGVLRGVAEIQRLRGHRKAGIRIMVDDVDSFMYVRLLNAKPTEVAAMNEELAEYVVNKPHLADDPGMKFIAAFAGADANGRQS